MQRAPLGTLHVAISGCSLQWFQKIFAIVAKIRTEPFFVESLQIQKGCETSWREGLLHASTYLQRHCNTRKIALRNTCLKLRQK